MIVTAGIRNYASRNLFGVTPFLFSSFYLLVDKIIEAAVHSVFVPGN